MPTRHLLNNARSVTSTTSTPRTLLLTLDAFDTLFHPRQPVPEQYATTAHEFGLSRTAITPQKLKAAFKTIFREQAARYPNYGRADVLRGRYGGPKQWWEEVIRGSFSRALLSEGASGSRNSARATQAATSINPNPDFDPHLPVGMVEALVDRFAGAEGYTLYEDVEPFFARLRKLKVNAGATNRRFDRVLVGVVSNSDDRVPAVLRALGLRVGDLRADQDFSSMELPGFEQRGKKIGRDDSDESGRSVQSEVDLDLVITSYEAGEEKPHRLIFDVAERQARLLASSSVGTRISSSPGDWVCVHVGDDYEKDYLGALDAGWQSYLLCRGGGEERGAQTISSLTELIHELEID
ncbi:hypothetical protein N7466_005896 [Penicillium verhagenii]|uniref:uncharacterized protein n=1 Tax=Penicillium verhagenii TaxID=1562060 RepID=UPI002545B78C|nr:uncharacterized protein N7466_005896 [Penicillium verhagenii]KAJ5930403.1 hypothetical protein N7466_005896 [Penicillium verhagenii]